MAVAMAAGKVAAAVVAGKVAAAAATEAANKSSKLSKVYFSQNEYRVSHSYFYRSIVKGQRIESSTHCKKYL